MLRVVYAQPHYSEIVICEAPVGSSLFWTAKAPMPWKDGKVHGRWRLGTPVGDTLQPRTRIVPFCHEVPEGKLTACIRDAASRLPPVRQNGGTLGVILKRYGVKERSLRKYSVFPLDHDDILAVGFFHIPPTTDPYWVEYLSAFAEEPPKPGLPTKLKPSKPITPVNAQRWGG
jgi:hypothetical protein